MAGTRRPTSPRSPRPGGVSRRPASAARVRSEPSSGNLPVPRGFTRRAAVLALLALVIAVAISPFLRAWLEQQSEVAALRADISAREERIDRLDDQLVRWDDDAYVVAQARERFTYVMPGEIGYVVLDESRAEQDAADPTAAAARSVAAEHGSWFGALWTSVQLAAGTEAPAGVAPPPDPAP